MLALGNLDGVLITIPFKARIVPYATRLGPAAQCIGAANALRREADGTWTGDMFDGVGFIRGAERKGERVHGRRVALFGAGGAGSAIAYELAKAGAHLDLEELFRVFDYTEYGGAPLLGVNGISIICHGGSPPRAIRNAVRVARQAIETKLLGHIEKMVAELGTSGEPDAAVAGGARWSGRTRSEGV